MRLSAKNLLFGLCLLPFASKIPYMVGVWRLSPLEDGDALMWVGAVISAILCEFVRRDVCPEYVPEPRFGCVVAALVAAVALFVSVGFFVNAVGILIALFIGAVALDLRFGRIVCVSQTPTFVFAVLGCPSVSFWLDYYLHFGLSEQMSFLMLKFAASAIFMLSWCAISFAKRHFPRAENILFYAAVAFAAVFNRVESDTPATAQPLEIDTSVVKSGVWISKSAEPRDGDDRFFGGCSKIERRIYFNDRAGLNLLALEVVDKKTMHPIGICMKSTGAKVLSSRQIYIGAREEKLQAEELCVCIGDRKYAVWSWFSNGKYSTGDFRIFRLSFEKRKWAHYQAMIPLSKGVDSRAEFADFIENFGRHMQK